jgi:hypothetical protein
VDCVLSYHMNGATCGVARFNALLAQQFGVPMLQVFDDTVLEHEAPLLSIKIEEVSTFDLQALRRRLDELFARQSVGIFLHTFSGTEVEREILNRAAAVYCGNGEIRAQLAMSRPDAVELWCPGMIRSRDRFEAADLRVFSFGMAHKVRSDYYVKLHGLLEASGRSYALYLSTALHENTSLDDSFNGAFDELRALFGDRVHFLGFLSDAGVYNYLLDTTYFAAFFEKGVRANNTSVNAAMACGSVVITNLDKFSPVAFKHDHNLFNIEYLNVLPTEPAILARIRSRASETAQGALGWESFVSRLGSLEASRSQAADAARGRILARPFRP